MRMELHKISLRVKITAGIIALLFILGASVIAFVRVRLLSALKEDLTKRGVVIAKQLAYQSAEPILTNSVFALHELAQDTIRNNDDVRYVFVLDRYGKVIAHTFPRGLPRGLARANFPGSDNEYRRQLIKTEEGWIQDIAFPILGGQVGAARVGMSETRVFQTAASTVRDLSRVIITIFAGGVVVAYVLTLLLTRPILQLVQVTHDVRAGNLDSQASINTRDEIGELAAGFNKMIAELKESTHQLVAARDYIDDVIKSMGDALIVLDTADKMTMINRSALSLTGYDENELIGRSVDDLFPQLHAVPGATDTILLTKSSEEVPVILSKSAIMDEKRGLLGSVITARDIKEIKRLISSLEDARAELETKYRDLEVEVEQKSKELERTQAHLVHSDRLASVGQLAAGVAHELNNPLGGILTYAKLITREVENASDNGLEGETISQYAAIIEKESDRCRKVIRSLLDFSRTKEPEMAAIDINSILEEVILLVEHQAEVQDVIIKKELCTSLPTIPGDPSQLHQVFVNVILNALQAMPTGGSLGVASQLSSGKVAERFRFVEVTIKDIGCGIPEEDLPKIFDPFFTTKTLDEGTGLGLSVVCNIVLRHNGNIDVQSTVGTGTTVSIRLPVEQQLPAFDRLVR